MPFNNVTDGLIMKTPFGEAMADPTWIFVAKPELPPVVHNLAFAIFVVTGTEVPVVLNVKDVACNGLPAPSVTISIPIIW